MAGFSWKDLKKKPSSANDVVGSSVPSTLEQAANLSPMLAKLMMQRETLEAKMQAATQGGAALSGNRESRVFPVQTLAQRRNEIKQWEAKKDQRKQALNAKQQSERPNPSAQDESLFSRVFNRDMDENRVLSNKLNLQKPLDRFRSIDNADPPLRSTAAELFKERIMPVREQISDKLNDAKSYEALKDRLLSVEVGSLNDLGKRLDQQREAALEKLIQEREQEAQDLLRRERALENRRKRYSEQDEFI